MMEKNEKARLKAAIQEKVESLKADIDAFKILSQPVPPDNAIGRLTRMEAINSRSINEAALAKAQNTLARLERALPRLDHADFGLCRECEEPIPFARLMALPETDLCVHCAAKRGG
jgi:DnaK suppressor protein